MPTARQHRKPATPKEVKEAEKIARQMYSSLTASGAPKATPAGYVMGAAQVLKMLIEQAARQGADKEHLKLYTLQFVNAI